MNGLRMLEHWGRTRRGAINGELREAVGTRRVNPVARFAKLLLIRLLAVLVIGGSIVLVRKWPGGG
jgi:hypothetical protein